MKLYQNGDILTMNAAGERAGSMAVEGEHIVRVGDEEELAEEFPHAKKVDLRGRRCV